MTSNTNAEGILQYAVDQLVIERDELRVAYQEQVEHNRFAASKHSEHIHELSDHLNELRAENELLRAEAWKRDYRADEAEAEVERLNQALDMLAEQREAWKAKAEQLRKQFAMSDSDEALMLRAEVERLRAVLGEFESIRRTGPPVDMLDVQAMWRRFCDALDRPKE